MKIVTWNCNGTLRDKFETLHKLNADIYIIQECENPKETKHERYREWSSNSLWIGDIPNRGLGIFAGRNIKITSLPWSNHFQDHTVKYFLPCLVNNDFQLLGIWTHQNNSPTFEYIGQFWKYLQTNKRYFFEREIIIAGDFNSNVIWDKWDRWWNHSDVVKELKEMGIESVYHKMRCEEQGNESVPTFYMHRIITNNYNTGRETFLQQ
ncbi:MAG: endonuclease/exonuclease/phosphatase family protein [Chitinophaga sp.]|uniref:hypothetical protein n=1 Tax=Chitinophaga sp. TaxID=1869181 RepID=UPI0025BA0C4C|nr:hypothetical protein [Chitinophaga sp.]MBV8252275.1 endonuclease/exonuclease/phosphatase family protein [Chitinophaga sp.]